MTSKGRRRALPKPRRPYRMPARAVAAAATGKRILGAAVDVFWDGRCSAARRGSVGRRQSWRSSSSCNPYWRTLMTCILAHAPPTRRQRFAVTPILDMPRLQARSIGGNPGLVAVPGCRVAASGRLRGRPKAEGSQQEVRQPNSLSVNSRKRERAEGTGVTTFSPKLACEGRHQRSRLRKPPTPEARRHRRPIDRWIRKRPPSARRGRRNRSASAEPLLDPLR